jgi:hypothetical protein
MIIEKRIETDFHVTKIPGEAYSFEVRVVCPFDDLVTDKRVDEFRRKPFSLCEVDRLDFAAVNGISEKQNLKGG